MVFRAFSHPYASFQAHYRNTGGFIGSCYTGSAVVVRAPATVRRLLSK